MKKITLALALLLVIGLAAATAQELTANISGSATMTVGFDLDSQSFGIVNSATSSIDLDLIAKASASSESMDGWYGSVSLSNYEISFDGEDVLSANKPSVTAQITNGTTYVQIWSLDGFTTGFAASPEDNKSDISVEDADGAGIGENLDDGSGGFTFHTVAGPATINVFFATETGYDGTLSTDNGHFLVGSDITLAIDPASVSLEVVKGIGVANDGLGIGAKTSVAIGDLGTIKLAFDSAIPAGGTFDWEVRADIGLAVSGYGADVAVFYGDEIDVEVASKTIAIGPLSLNLLFGLYDLTTVTTSWGVDIGLAFAVNDMIGITVDTAYDSAGVIPLTVKATITNPIPHVKIVAQYATTDIAATNNLGDISVATTVSF